MGYLCQSFIPKARFTPEYLFGDSYSSVILTPGYCTILCDSPTLLSHLYKYAFFCLKKEGKKDNNNNLK